MSTRHRTTTPVDPVNLGDTSFEDWYDRPLFEIEADERLEQLATSRRAAVRAVGRMLLRIFSTRVETPPRRRATVRERAGRLLDHWADAEVASQQRLEELVLPRRRRL